MNVIKVVMTLLLVTALLWFCIELNSLVKEHGTYVTAKAQRMQYESLYKLQQQQLDYQNYQLNKLEDSLGLPHDFSNVNFWDKE